MTDLKAWHRTDHYKIAVLHASSLIQTAQRLMIHPKSVVCADTTTAATEYPHMAICIYLAMLILWAVKIISDPTDRAGSKFPILNGCNILSQLKVRVATVLLNALRRLDENTDQIVPEQ